MPTLADQIAPKPQQPSGLGGWLASIGDEMAGAFARYGRRSGAQRDASLEMLNQASAPGTDPIMGAGQKLLGLAGLITHPLAFFPTREEWDQRLQAAGNDGRMSRSIGGFLSDLPSLIDPQMAAGGAALAAAPIVGKLGRGISDLAGDATDAELAALRARLQAEAAQTGGAATTTTRDEALQNLVGEPQRKQMTTQSYKETLPDGTTRWVPGTLRSNPTAAPRFEPSMSIAEIRRYIEQFGEPPPPRAKGEIVTGKRKDHYPDGTVAPVPGLLRTKRPPSLGEALQGLVGGDDAPLAAKMLNTADGALDMSAAARAARAAEQGYTIDAYTGANRLDRLVEGIKPERATSGPMPYFTDSPDLASSYAKGKIDNSAVDELWDFNDQFTLNGKKLDQIGKSLSYTQKRDLAARLENISYDEDGNIVQAVGQPGGASLDHWRYLLRSHKGDPIAAAKELWLESGQIFGEEEKFAKVLDMAGIKGVEFDSPNVQAPGVLPAKLKMQNPLDTSKVDNLQAMLPELEVAAAKAPKPQYTQGGVDQWDKRTTDPMVWLERYKDDLKTGNTHAWTVVPDWVTEFLKSKGYDGIKDMGGKMGGPKHVVYIPFTPEQVRSRFAKFDPKNVGKAGLSLGLAGGVMLNQPDER